jgi:hypothetical protein
MPTSYSSLTLKTRPRGCSVTDTNNEEREVLARNRLLADAKHKHLRKVVHRLTYGQRDPMTDQFFTAKVLEV